MLAVALVQPEPETPDVLAIYFQPVGAVASSSLAANLLDAANNTQWDVEYQWIAFLISRAEEELVISHSHRPLDRGRETVRAQVSDIRVDSLNLFAFEERHVNLTQRGRVAFGALGESDVTVPAAGMASVKLAGRGRRRAVQVGPLRRAGRPDRGRRRARAEAGVVSRWRRWWLRADAPLSRPVVVPVGPFGRRRTRGAPVRVHGEVTGRPEREPEVASLASRAEKHDSRRNS